MEKIEKKLADENGIKPLSDWVVAEEIEHSSKKSGNLILSWKSEPVRAKVLKGGPECSLKFGDMIYIMEGTRCKEVDYKGKKYILAREKDLTVYE